MARRLYDVGEPRNLDGGRWVLNPLAPFPITIEGGDSKTIVSLKRSLDKSMNGASETLDRALYLFSKHRLRCIEVEAWASDVRPVFIAGVNQRIASSDEYRTLMERPDATVNRRARLEKQFRDEAYLALEVRPSRDFSAVIDDGGDQRPVAVVDLLMHGYRRAAHAAERIRRQEEYRRDISVPGWWIRGAETACAHCRRFFGTHAASYYPRIPIHIGCDCDIHAVSERAKGADTCFQLQCEAILSRGWKCSVGDRIDLRDNPGRRPSILPGESSWSCCGQCSFSFSQPIDERMKGGRNGVGIHELGYIAPILARYHEGGLQDHYSEDGPGYGLEYGEDWRHSRYPWLRDGKQKVGFSVGRSPLIDRPTIERPLPPDPLPRVRGSKAFFDRDGEETISEIAVCGASGVCSDQCCKHVASSRLLRKNMKSAATGSTQHSGLQARFYRDEERATIKGSKRGQSLAHRRLPFTKLLLKVYGA